MNWYIEHSVSSKKAAPWSSCLCCQRWERHCFVVHDSRWPPYGVGLPLSTCPPWNETCLASMPQVSAFPFFLFCWCLHKKEGKREFSNEFLLFWWENDHKQNVKLENQTYFSGFKKGVKLMKTKEKHYVYCDEWMKLKAKGICERNGFLQKCGVALTHHHDILRVCQLWVLFICCVCTKMHL